MKRQGQLQEQQQEPHEQQQVQPAGAPGVTALAVASRFRAELSNLMRREWLRVDRDIRDGSGIPRAWLRGPSPVLSRAAFLERWHGLVTLPAGEDPSLVISLAGLP